MRIRREGQPDDARVGTGAVTTRAQVTDGVAPGGHRSSLLKTRPTSLRRRCSWVLSIYLGVATPIEAFAALGAGATALEILPSDSMGIAGMNVWPSVLPADTQLAARWWCR